VTPANGVGVSALEVGPICNGPGYVMEARITYPAANCGELRAKREEERVKSRAQRARRELRRSLPLCSRRETFGERGDWGSINC